VTRGRLPQAGSLSLNGGGAADAVPPDNVVRRHYGIIFPNFSFLFNFSVNYSSFKDLHTG